MVENEGWRLRPAAEADLSQIWREGAKAWGWDQAERYVDGLFGLFDLLTSFPETARIRSEFTPEVRIHPHRAHLVVYREATFGIDIIRLLHSHQNLAAYLAED